MTPDLDGDRTRFRGHVFGLVRKATPLLFRHDPNQIAGEIEELKWTATGALYIRACVPSSRGAALWCVFGWRQGVELQAAQCRHGGLLRRG
jgi:hypothetical protein